MTALLAFAWDALVIAALMLAAVTAGATWDRATAAARHHYAPGRHRR